MKKFKILFALLAIGLLIPSCEDDGGDSKLNLQVGAVPNVTKVATTQSYINLVAINAGEEINIGFTIDKAQGNVESMNVVLFYIKPDAVYKGTLATDVKTFPTTYSLSQTDLFEIFDELNVPEDFQVGDRLIVSTEILLKNGNLIKVIKDDGTPSYGIDVNSSPLYEPSQTFLVSCASNLGGTYNYITTNVSAPTGESATGPLTGSITLTDTGGGVYKISDASFGGWLGLYGPGNIATGVTLTDICNQIAYTGVDQYGEVFTFSNLVVNGNQLSFHWENDYGEFGDTTLVRTDGTDWPDLYL